MSIIDGISQATGIRFGMSLMNREEMRPILRKRFLANLVYLFSLLWCFSTTFSLRPDGSTSHVFLSWLDRNEWFVLLVKKWGVIIRSPWMFTWAMLFMAIIVTIVVLLLEARPGKKDFHFSWFGYLVVTSFYSFISYASVYDLLYYWLEDRCIPFINVFCLNFASNAGRFAFWAWLVYWFRSVYLILPLENGTIAFFGRGLVDVKGAGLLFVPTIPMPHLLCVACNYAFDMVPFFWDIYHHPDGRERAVQNHIRYLRD